MNRVRPEVPSLATVSLFLFLSLLPPSLASFCLQPFVPENGHVIFAEPGPYPIGTVARYSCAIGFERIGPEERRCGSDGRWRGKSPICVVDVARGRPFQLSEPQSNLSSRWPLSTNECVSTSKKGKSWFAISIASPALIRAIQLGLGPSSSLVDGIELIQESGDVCKCPVDNQQHANSTIIFDCDCANVVRLRLLFPSRLHVCSLKAFAADAVSPWQCGNDAANLEHLGVIGGRCYATSRVKADWPRAARSCSENGGGTLPMRLDEDAMSFLGTAIDSLRTPAPFYWIGIFSDVNEWRYADGAPVGPMETNFAEKSVPATDGEAILLSRETGWKWAAGLQTGWNHYICQNKPKFCTSPGVGEAGRVSFSSHSYAVGTTCYYECEDGFELEGNSQRICSAHGKWTGTIPVCRSVDCGSPPTFMGETHLLNETTTFGSQIDYECPRGFRPVGPTRRFCAADGNWDAPPPVCKRVDCGRPAPIANGNAHFTSTNLNSSAVYDCSVGFRLIGHDTVFCSERGIWEPVSPVCYDVSALREMQGGAGEANAILAIAAVALIILLVVIIARHTRGSWSSDAKSSIATTDTMGANSSGVIYAQAQAFRPMPSHVDSTVYYAASVPLTQLEVPPQLLQLQQLPNGNIHVTLPLGRQTARPSLPQFTAQPSMSPTDSQILYSFEHEPIYDVPPPEETRDMNEEFDSVYGSVTAPESDSTVC